MFDYFTLEELRERPEMDDVDLYTPAKCEAAAAFIVGAIEREVGTSFVARTWTDEQHSGGVSRILLDHPYALDAVSATEDDVEVTDTLRIIGGGTLLRLSGSVPVAWANGYGNVLVTYTAGYSRVPPPDVKEQALVGTRAHLLSTSVDSGVDPRQTSLSMATGVVNFVVAGLDNPTGWPTVDAMILSWKEQLDVHGFA